MVAEGASPTPVLEIKDLVKEFPGRKKGEEVLAVDHVNITVPDEERGEFVALLGPSGCGKSTILSMVGGLMEPTSGEVLTLGKPVQGSNPDTVTVQQAYTCYPWLTALGNVEFGLNIQGKGKGEAKDIASEYLRKVGLGDRLGAFPRELSGGMQQRIAIARALAIKAKIVLMDEPFGALDAQTRAEMQQLLLQLWTEEKQSIFFVTHDITEAVLLAERVIVFSSRPAKIVHDLRVPFGRPRPQELVSDPHFVEICQSLLSLLKQSPSGGQVRVSL
ncbi:MAG TPA: ABC transporter ATP-binding protein [Fimbriimonas sp.]|nr:ABC transporter ATP-binding protein [Fimbriimonas sp.]